MPACWALDFADYQANMTITYKPGPYNQADALSRLVGQTLASVNLIFTQFMLSNNFSNNSTLRRLTQLIHITNLHLPSSPPLMVSITSKTIFVYQLTSPSALHLLAFI